MLDISWNEKSLNSFYKKMENVITNLKKHVEEGINEASEDTRKYALSQKVGSKKDDLILKELSTKGNQVISRIYTNFNYAPFLEYGTGRYAEMPHIGKSRTFRESGFRFWYAPASAVKKNYGEDEYLVYNDMTYPMIAFFKGEKYVLVFEQKARPFMRPAGFYMRNNNVETVKKRIQEGILSDIK